jgi:ABC-type multidrug transport system fused ATPase/permease subunit
MFITYLAVNAFEKRINPLRDKINKSDNILSEIIYDTISNITTIKMLSLASLVGKSLARETSTKFTSYNKKILLNEIKWYIPSFIGSLFIVGVLLFYVYKIYVFGSVLMIGSLYVLYSFLARLKNVLYDFAWMISDIQEQNRDIMNSELISKHFGEIDRNVVAQRRHLEKLELSDLHFSYNDTYKLSIDTLLLEKGKKYAFVGESGCGKTTILKILSSLIKVNEYTCKINGVDAQLESLKDITMLIPQEPELFSNTVRENITLGIPFEQKEVDEIVELVKMTETILSLPEGIESKIFEKGVNLSGGQKQRLALARGLLFAKDKEILLLDEPTSSVDQMNEVDIYRSIFERYQGKLIVSSIHKLNLLSLFDYVVYFEEGGIVRVVDAKNL